MIAVRDLRVAYPLGGRLLGARRTLTAVAGVDLDIARGEIVGLVGESGSGKTTIGRAILGAAPVTGGTVAYDDGEVALPVHAMDRVQERSLRARAQLVFQDPHAALSPRMTVRDIIAEPLEVQRRGTRAEIDARVREVAALCRLNLEHLRRFPHAFSGGQRQRIAIARALACGPRLLVADEAVAALDVSIQADVLNLLKSLRDRLGLAILFISHDLSVVGHLCDRVAVLYLGRLVEVAPARTLFRAPRHPYTRALLAAVPSLDPDAPRPARLPGEIPSPADPPSGCRFRTRCAHATALCAEQRPEMEPTDEGHVACHHWRALA